MFLIKERHQDIYAIDGFHLLKSHPKIFEWTFKHLRFLNFKMLLSSINHFCHFITSCHSSKCLNYFLLQLPLETSSSYHSLFSLLLLLYSYTIPVSCYLILAFLDCASKKSSMSQTKEKSTLPIQETSFYCHHKDVLMMGL